MIIPAVVLSIGAALGFGLWRLAEYENAREYADEVNRVGGLNSPWGAPQVPASVTANPEFWEQLDRRYSPEQVAQIEADPGEFLVAAEQAYTAASVSTPDSPHVSQLVSVYPYTSVSAPVSTSPITQVQPAVEVVATTPPTTGCDDPAVEWLEANAEHFPVPMPPALVDGYSDRMALAKASGWVARAIAAGVSQNKTVTVVFGQSKGTAAYDRIVELYRALKND